MKPGPRRKNQETTKPEQMRKKIFLLGGYDLEMMEIKNLLSLNKLNFIDKQLNWSNASLLEYSEELNKYGNTSDWDIYGIELQEYGMESIPSNYYRIDHHNELNHLPSSLEQVAVILGLQLDYRQQLIAANDKAYIPGMLQLGASEKEIAEIRQADRKIQGVTVQDEKLAEKAIEKKILVKDILVVKSASNRFSAICDRLYPYTKLLIYTNDELMYYGKGKGALVEIFNSEIQKGKMFHGGGKDGYIGTDRGAYSLEEIEMLKNKIIDTLKLT